MPTRMKCKPRYLDKAAIHCTLWIAGALFGILVGLLKIGADTTVVFAQDSVGSYAVVPGDTLGVIADRFGVSVDALVTLNGIADRNLIEVGQLLLIPDANAELSAVETTLVHARPGDSLADVALRYGQDVPVLIALNSISATNRLFPGQTVRLPASQQPPPPLRFGAIARVVVPTQLAQGRTGRLLIETRRPLSPTATWNGLPLTFTTLSSPGIIPSTSVTATVTTSVTTGPYRYFALIPVPALIQPAAYELNIAYIARGGVELRRTWFVNVVAGDYASQNIVLPPTKGDLLAPERVENELEKLTAVWSVHSPQLHWQNRFARPIEEQFATTSPYGTRRSYNGGPVASYHSGQDFGAPEGITVTAPATGTIALAEPLAVRGNAVLIDHGRGVFTGYWHLSELKAVVGQRVGPGDVIGLVGTTGLSTGAHLHWELRVYGIAVNPMQFLAEPLVDVK